MAFSYMDEYYGCERCGAAAVFTAVAQRHAFEVEKMLRKPGELK